MAANRNGRVIYLDAPGTYTALYDAKEFVQLDFVLVYAPTNATTLTLYANAAVVATAQLGVFAAAVGESEQFTLSPGEMVPPDSFQGLTAVLAGAGSFAWIYVA
jgi:hypothetical protein